MTNLENKLTVDDLIVEYMMCKLNNDYEPSFTTKEFMEFLCFFENKMEVSDILYDGEQLFQRFFERKQESDWSYTDFMSKEKRFESHLTKEDDTILPCYNFGDYDKSIINTYFMEKNKQEEIRNIIKEYLKDTPKRKINISSNISEENLNVGKSVAAEIISNIWNGYVKDKIKENKLPKQCKDIDKYLLEIDLAPIVGLPSIKEELLNFYSVVSKRIAVLYQEDKNLKISSCSNVYLANSNYRCVFEGYENLLSYAYGKYKKILTINLENKIIEQSYEIDTQNTDSETCIQTDASNIENNDTRVLVKKLNDLVKQ